MKNIEKEIENYVERNATFIGVVSAIGVLAIGLYAFLESSAENTLTREKMRNMNPPAASEQCGPEQGMGCYYQTIGKLCDGNNTMLNFEDDSCETIQYWRYAPEVARY